MAWGQWARVRVSLGPGTAYAGAAAPPFTLRFPSGRTASPPRGGCGRFHPSRASGRRDAPAPRPWIPAFAGKTMGVCGPASAAGVGGGGPAVAGRAFRERPLRLGWWVGSLGRSVVGGGGAGPSPRRPVGAAAPLFTLRFPSGRTDATAPHRSLIEGLCANGLPCPAPVTLRQAQGERFPWSCACHSSRALGSTASPASPLWIPAFAGMTMGVWGPSSADGGGGARPAVAGRAFRERPLRCVGGVGVASLGGSELAPPGVHSPFDFPQGERTPPPLWIPAFAGMARRGAERRGRGPSTGSGRTAFRVPTLRGRFPCCLGG